MKEKSKLRSSLSKNSLCVNNNSGDSHNCDHVSENTLGCPSNTIQHIQASPTYNNVLQEVKSRLLKYPSRSPSADLQAPMGPDSDSDFDSDADVSSDKDVQVNVAVDDDDDDDNGFVEDGENNEGEEESSDEEEDEEDDEYPSVVWTGYGKKIPVMIFKADAITQRKPEYRVIGEKFHLAYKLVKTESKLLRVLFDTHGFSEAHPNSSDFNLMWTGTHLKPYILRGLHEFQKVNHFPRSYEITRKDRLFKNIQRMQQTKGYKHFDFVPLSYIIPGEFQDFCTAFLKDKGPWIVKPIALSRGRGIFLVNHPEQVPLDETLIVSRYIGNPLLIDGFKFDVRLYVAVTSYDPLIIYMYEEGLTRFATVKYEKNARNIRNTMMHLTNYSVNKKSQDYVKNDDPDVEDFGNKWSLGALLRYLRSQGKDTTAMMMRIEDVIIKTILCAELPIATACKMFMPYRGNCFEVYGFDILVDENLRPWLLEVNLSPSLACDAPIDLKIKSNMLSDLFSLIGFICHDPMMRLGKMTRQGKLICDSLKKCVDIYLDLSQTRPGSSGSIRKRPGSAGSNKSTPYSRATNAVNPTGRGTGLTSEEIKITRRAKEEYQRRGGWIRIFPTPDSWEIYSSYMQYTTTNNLMLWQQLFPDRAKSTLSLKPSTAAYSSNLARTKSVHLHSAQYPQLYISTQLKPGVLLDKDDALAQALQRSLQYERKLNTAGERKKRKNNQKSGPKRGAPNVNSHFKGSLVQGVPEDTMSISTKVTTDDESKSSHRKDNPTRKKSEVNAEVTGKPPLKRSDSKTSASNSSNLTRLEGCGEGKRESKTATSKSNLESNSKTSIKIINNVGSGSSHQENSQKSSSKLNVLKQQNARNDRNSETSSVSSHTSSATQQSGTVHVRSRDPSPAAVRTQQNLPKFHYNVVELLEKGKQMNKVQARHAFATYLTRVQHRLLVESTVEGDDMEQANEQMDLVLRFLKRAAGNLQQPFKVVVPSRKLALNDRRRILAKQLGDFVHIYNKETDQLRQRHLIDRKCLKKGKEPNTLDEDKFNKFVHTASETELEEVLTTYTKLNKSASIFLGSNSKSSSDRVPSGHPGAQLERRKEHSTISDLSDAASELRNGYNSGSVSDIASDSGVTSAPNGPYTNSTAHHRIPSQSSFSSAVAIYSTKLTNSHHNHGSTMLRRPSSANSHGSNVLSNKVGMSMKTRPSSASMRVVASDTHQQQSIGIREGPDGAEAADAQNSEEGINSALQRIALRQQQRQYIASRGSNVLASSTENTPRYPADKHSNPSNGRQVEDYVKYSSSNGKVVQTNVDNYPLHDSHPSDSSEHVNRDSIKPTTKESLRSTTKTIRTANDTFNSFVNDQHSTNSNNKNFTPTFQSTQYQIAQHQMMLKQQRMIEQSKALLEQSKAKHQAMIAQVHAAQKGLGDQNDLQDHDGILLAPKPPQYPAHERKVVGSHRMARTQLLDDGYNTDGNFYSSLKYDSYTGTTSKPKISYSTAYNTGL